MSEQMKDIQVIRLLNSQIHLCDEIRKLLIKKETRNLPFVQEYTEHDIIDIALNRLMSELISRHKHV
ncbi:MULTISPECIES: hypothetical protein [Priestia]|jgi:hypothetical protein|uniref:hypothetical protein n=1 Tax=Priestia TaxID=2800373 RepID=UPI0006807EF5|nr:MULTISPECIES: hypothetical protein [Priestia]KNH24009.1 hypothetical protein ACS78_06960 [Priestia megaterium]MBX9993850.1 hypothetical protein [Priestia aryabhattai]MCM3151543.1 hypothetical protein [Priestia megaterium]MCP1451169.1 hypothetical protein [Priestia megaterium]MDC7770756.1 hypothetical protein [Priestia megaterium]